MIGVAAVVSIVAPFGLPLAILKVFTTAGFVILVVLVPFGLAVPAGGGGGPGGGCWGSSIMSSFFF